MKRILKFGGALLALGMLLASCNMITADSTVSGNSTEQESSNINGITIGVNSIVNTERTILPADWTADTASSLTYVLMGKQTDVAGEYDEKATFTYSELTGKTAVVNLELVRWDLKLIGYITVSGEADTTKACLAEELKNVDFSKGKKTVAFNLKPVQTNADDSKTEATGKVDVTIAWLTTQPKRLEFGIYELEKSTNEIVENTGRGDVFSNFKQTTTDFAPDGTAYKYTWQQADVPAGMYKFAAVFYNDATAGEVIGYYIDYLYVDGGNVSKATINYGDKFNTIPDNPTWLAVETAFVPQEGPATITVNEWYYAKFHWNDNSTNETGFEIVINDGTKDYVVAPGKDDDHLISDKWHDGTTETTFTTDTPNNLDAGRTWVVLKLKTETLYTAKIRAINKYTPDYDDADDDDFCDNLNRNGDGKGRSYAPIVGDDKQFGMFTVNYALNGGIVTKADGSTTGPTVTNYVVGFNYHSEQQDLMTDNILSCPYVSKTGYVFDHWNGAEAKRLDVIPAENKVKLPLTAVWSGSDVRVSVTFPSYADAQDVKIAADQNSDNTVLFEYSPENNFVSVTAGASLVTPQFELTEVGNKGAIIATGGNDTVGTKVEGSVWTWKPTEAPTPGLYCLQITGGYTDANTGRTLDLCGNVYIEVKN